MIMGLRASDILRWKNAALSRQVFGFALVGLLRTVLSYLLYVALLAYFPYWIAFSVSYGIGILTSAYANGLYVFAVEITVRRAVRYGLVYSTFYILSLGILVFSIEILRLPPFIAPVCVIAVMFPFNFLAERYALTR